jgi:hypothetical protein
MSLSCGHQRAYCSSLRWYMSMGRYGGITLTGKSEKLSPSTTLSKTNLTWTDPGETTELRSEGPVTNRLSLSTAFPRQCNTTYVRNNLRKI